MNRTDLKPARCSLFKTKDDEGEMETAHEQSESSNQNSTQEPRLKDFLSWQEVLINLRQRNADKVAVSTLLTRNSFYLIVSEW